MDATIEFTAGAIGGAAGVLFGHPFDTTKVCMQTVSGNSNLRSILQTVALKGWRGGFLRGLSFPLTSSAAVNAMFFGVYVRTLQALEADVSKPRLHHAAIAGLVGGLAQWPLSCPVESVKVAMQSQLTRQEGTLKYFSGPFDCARTLFRTGGLRALFRGGLALAIRDIPTFGIYVAVYETTLATARKNIELGESTTVLLCGGLGGMASWTLAVPSDVIKSRLQSDPEKLRYRSLTDCVMKTFREEGIIAFSKGLLLINVRAFVVNGIIFWGWAVSLEFMKRLKAN